MNRARSDRRLARPGPPPPPPPQKADKTNSANQATPVSPLDVVANDRAAVTAGASVRTNIQDTHKSEPINQAEHQSNTDTVHVSSASRSLAEDIDLTEGIKGSKQTNMRLDMNSSSPAQLPRTTLTASVSSLESSNSGGSRSPRMRKTRPAPPPPKPPDKQRSGCVVKVDGPPKQSGAAVDNSANAGVSIKHPTAVTPPVTEKLKCENRAIQNDTDKSLNKAAEKINTDRTVLAASGCNNELVLTGNVTPQQQPISSPGSRNAATAELSSKECPRAAQLGGLNQSINQAAAVVKTGGECMEVGGVSTRECEQFGDEEDFPPPPPELMQTTPTIDSVPTPQHNNSSCSVTNQFNYYKSGTEITEQPSNLHHRNNTTTTSVVPATKGGLMVSIKPAIVSPKPKMKAMGVPPPPPPPPESPCTPAPVAAMTSARHHSDESAGNYANIKSSVQNDNHSQDLCGEESDLLRDVLSVLDCHSPISSAASEINKTNDSSLNENNSDPNPTVNNRSDLNYTEESTQFQPSLISADKKCLSTQNTAKSNKEAADNVRAPDCNQADSSIPCAKQSPGTVCASQGKEQVPGTSAVTQPLRIHTDFSPSSSKNSSSGALASEKQSPTPSIGHSPNSLTGRRNHTRSVTAPSQRTRPVTRRRSTLRMLLCCGLGNVYASRSKHSPPMELPMRTEGTRPRSGEHVVKSTSLPSNIHAPPSSTPSPGSHTEHCLVQSDVTTYPSDPVIANSLQAPDSIHVANKLNHSIVDAKKSSNSNPTVDLQHSSDSKYESNNSQELANRDNAHDKTTADSKLIDALCKSETPISLDKLARDNKYLVIDDRDKEQRLSSASGTSPVDTCDRPVVHGVRLIERRPADEPAAPEVAGQHFARGTPPRVSAPHLKNASKLTTDSLLPSPHLPTPTLPPGSAVPLRRDAQLKSFRRDPQKVRSQSVEDLSSVILDFDLNVATHLIRGQEYRSSFVGSDSGDTKPALTRPPGEIQTLLKHGSKENEKVYALPQPACYSENTLKAVRLITDKYDTLERWKICATSFNGDGKRASKGAAPGPPSRQASRDSKTDLLEGISESAGNDASAVTDEGGDAIDGVSPAVAAQHAQLSASEQGRIRIFYSSRETRVWPAQCCVQLQLSVRQVERAADVKEWQQGSCGVPAFVLTSGEGRTRRQLTLVIADRDSGFPLWSDRVNHLSQYSALTPTRHTMHLSEHLLQVAALDFPSEQFAAHFMDAFKEITSDPSDDLWKVKVDPKQHAKRVKQAAQASRKPSKLRGDISKPIQFDHVTFISAKDASVCENLARADANSGHDTDLEKAVVVTSLRSRTYSN